MKSRITIEVDFQTGKPYFQIIADTESEHICDKAIREFRYVLGHESCWARIRFHDDYKPGQKYFSIEPITQADIEREAEMMNKVVEKLKTSCTPVPYR